MPFVPERRRRKRSPERRTLLRPFIWLSQHLQSALSSLGQLRRSPLATLMTAAVIGIALALPASLYVFARNLQQLSRTWQPTAALSLFLHLDVQQPQAERLAQRLLDKPDIQSVQLILPDQALESLKSDPAFAEAIAQLPENPLPVVIALSPAPRLADPESLEALADWLSSLPEVEFARLDTRWMQRFQGILALVERLVLLLAFALSGGVLLIIGNTIRLEIENRREEIEIMDLVGATPGFIRRPFLYIGIWYGLLGGGIAWVLIAFGLFLLQEPVAHLAQLYQMDFHLKGLEAKELGTLLGGSAGLGLLGSWLSVGRHLQTASTR